MPVEFSRQILAWIHSLHQGLQEMGEVHFGDPHLVWMLQFVGSEQCCGTVQFCLGSGSGSGTQILYPRFPFRLRFRFLPSNFKLFFLYKLLPVTLIIVSSLTSFMHVLASVPPE